MMSETTEHTDPDLSASHSTQTITGERRKSKKYYLYLEAQTDERELPPDYFIINPKLFLNCMIT